MPITRRQAQDARALRVLARSDVRDIAALRQAKRKRLQVQQQKKRERQELANRQTVRHLVQGAVARVINADDRQTVRNLVQGAVDKSVVKDMVQGAVARAVKADEKRRFDHAIARVDLARGMRHYNMANAPPLNRTVFQAYLKRLFRSKLQNFRPFQYNRKFEADFRAMSSGVSRCGTHALLLHQAVAQTLATVLVEGTDPNQRGFLVFASTGSGKTVTALAIMLALWNSPKRLVFCTTPDNMKDNSLDTYADNLAAYFPKVFPKHSSESQSRWHDRLVDILRARLSDTWSFTRLASKIGLAGSIQASDPHFLTKGEGSVVIMDEAHNISAPKQPQYAKKYEQLRDYLTKSEVQGKVDVIALTATPGDNPKEVLALMSLVRRKSQQPFKLADFTKEDGSLAKSKLGRAMYGLISYVDLAGDTGRVAQVKILEHDVAMSQNHYEMYRLKFVQMPAAEKKWNPDNKKQFYKMARRASDMVTADGPWRTALRLRSSVVPSEKFQVAVDNLTTRPGKHYLYSAFSTPGVTQIAKMLRERGYEEITPNNLSSANREGHRFMIYDKGAYTQDQNRRLKQFFNGEGNVRGMFCKILLASNEYFTGLDLTALQHVHLLEPLVTSLMDAQAVGRGARTCAHHHLSPAERLVTIHRYFSTVPQHRIDDHINFSIGIAKAAFPIYRAARIKLAALKRPKKRDVEAIKEQEGIASATMQLAEPLYGKAMRARKLKREEAINKWASVPAEEKMVDRFIFKQAKDRDAPLQNMLDVLKSAAMDCILMQPLHARLRIKCAFDKKRKKRHH